MKVYYEEILVADVATSHSRNLDELLELIDFDEDEFKKEHLFEEIDYNDFRTEN